MELCISLNILCSVENPENSLFWEYPDIKRVIGKGFFTEFHNCMHGGKRRKSTSWWATKTVFNELQSICDNSHQHSSWAPTMTAKGLVFPTAEEAAYPELLCKRVAAIIHQYALQEGAIGPQNLSQQLAVRHHTSHRWILDMLPRGKKFKPLVSEFSHYLNFAVAASLEPEHSWFFKQQPKGTRVTARHLQRGCMRVDDNGGLEWTEAKTSKRVNLEWAGPEIHLDTNIDIEVCTVGIPREPWDFVQKAIQVGHPRSMAIHLSKGVTEMLEYNFKFPPHMVVQKRADFPKKWTTRCSELRETERDLHSTLEPHVAHVLKGKRLKLFKEILDHLSYPDSSLVDDLQGGFKLTGWLPRSGVFPQTMKKPDRTVDSALRAAKGLDKSILKPVEQVTWNLLRKFGTSQKQNLTGGGCFWTRIVTPQIFYLARGLGFVKRTRRVLLMIAALADSTKLAGHQNG